MDETKTGSVKLGEYGHCACYDYAPDHKDITLNQLKSRLSYRYISAIASYLNYIPSEPDLDCDYGIDVSLRPVCIKKIWKYKPCVDFQLKAITSPIIKDGYLKYDLDAKTFNIMRCSSMIGSSFLAILCLNTNTDKWISASAEGLHMGDVMYWCNLASYEDIPEGQGQIRLNIPLTNVLDEKSLHKILEKIAEFGRMYENEV